MTIDLWRTLPLNALKKGQGLEVVDEVEDDTLLTAEKLFRNDVAKYVLREFAGYDMNPTQHPIPEVSILVVARLDACIGTVVRATKVPLARGAASQRQFAETFAKLLPVALRKVIKVVTKTLLENFPEAFYSTGVSAMEGGGHNAVDVLRTEDGCYLRMNLTCFRENVCGVVGNVLDCFIAHREGRDGANGSYVPEAGAENDTE